MAILSFWILIWSLDLRVITILLSTLLNCFQELSIKIIWSLLKTAKRSACKKDNYNRNTILRVKKWNNQLSSFRFISMGRTPLPCNSKEQVECNVWHITSPGELKPMEKGDIIGVLQWSPHFQQCLELLSVLLPVLENSYCWIIWLMSPRWNTFKTKIFKGHFGNFSYPENGGQQIYICHVFSWSEWYFFSRMRTGKCPR